VKSALAHRDGKMWRVTGNLLPLSQHAQWHVWPGYAFKCDWAL